MAGEPQRDERDQDPARFDPWSGNHFGGARFFAASTLIHVGLLVAVRARCPFTVIEDAREDQREDRRGPGRRRGDRRRAVARGLRRPARGRQGADPPGAAAGADRSCATCARRACRRSAASGRSSAPGPTVDLNAASLALGGGGGVGGLGGSFGDYVGGLRKVGLDLVLVIDTTESMQFVIDEVKEHATALVADLQRMVPTAASASSSIATRATSTSPSGPI